MMIGTKLDSEALFVHLSREGNGCAFGVPQISQVATHTQGLIASNQMKNPNISDSNPVCNKTWLGAA
jgi:hypothetical protein